MTSDRYDVHIAFDADGAPQQVAEVLLQVFGKSEASVATAGAISSYDDRVVVHFYELVDQVPPHGDEFTPSRAEVPSEDAGRRAIDDLQEMHDEPTPLVPIARALVAVSAARARAGLSPRQSITIEVEPSPVHRQEELRHDWS